MAASDAGKDGSCPVNHATREAWLAKARESRPTPGPQTPTPSPSSSSALAPRLNKTRPLSQDRETSSIPRAASALAATTPNPFSASEASTCASAPATSVEAGHSMASNWIYPSEKMFFEAMRRKRHDPRATDMAAIVPLHNAVNERAWAEIRAWEARMPWASHANHRCGGPRLRSFAGDASRASPRARWNALLGYTRPFDRHDWVVERCRGEAAVEYVIDFYEGRRGSGGDGRINFYLDVRPKLNSWEGWKMRIANLIDPVIIILFLYGMLIQPVSHQPSLSSSMRPKDS